MSKDENVQVDSLRMAGSVAKTTKLAISGSDLEDFEGNTGDLTPKQVQAIEALLTFPTIEAAASEAGVSTRSITRWLRENDTFREALFSAQDDSLQKLNIRLISASDKALDTLLELATDPKVASGVRQRSAASIIESRLRLHESLSLDVRLQIVQNIQQDDQQQPTRYINFDEE